MDFKKAKHIKIGEKILLDVAYDAPHEEYCEVVEINPHAEDVFGYQGISFLVNTGTEHFWTHVFVPRQIVNFQK